LLAKLLAIPTLAAAAFSASCGSTLPAGVPPSGKIWFGSDFGKKNGALYIIDKKSVFHVKDQVAWVAHFNQDAGAHELTFELYAVKSGQNTSLFRQSTPMQSTNSNERAERAPVPSLIASGANRVGEYGIEYLRGTHVLATGTFHLSK
jgi:hypothetical protein